MNSPVASASVAEPGGSAGGRVMDNTVNSGLPTCHIMESRGRALVYDAYSNKVLRLAPVEKTILQAMCGRVSKEDTLRQVSDGWPGVDPVEVYERFLAQRQELDVLLPIRPLPVRVFGSAQDRQSVQHQLDCHLRSIVLEVTEECSMRCKYCIFSGSYDGRRMHSPHRMDYETARSAIDYLAQRSSHTTKALAICFYGGEPLLELQLLEEIVKYADKVLASREHGYHLTSNGLALQSRRARSFLSKNKVSLTVSLDGPRTIHDMCRRTRRGGPTHQLVEKGLEALRREYPEYYRECVRFNAVVWDPRQLSSIAEWFRGSHLFQESSGDLSLGPLDTKGVRAGSMKIMNVAKEKPRGRASVRQQYIRNRLGAVRPQDGLESLYAVDMARLAQRRTGPLTELHPQGYCIPGVRKLFVCADGTLCMCEKVNRSYSIGHLKAGFNVERIVNVLEVLTSQWSAGCSSCVAVRMCGMCPNDLWVDSDRADSRLLEATCRHNRARAVECIEIYVELCDRNPSYLRHLKEVALD